MIKFTIIGQLWSMKNSKIPTKSGIWIKNPKALAFEKAFAAQVTGKMRQNLSGKLILMCAIWYPSMRQDVDAELIADCCQKNGIVKNDRDFWHKYSYRAGIDKKNPRIDIEIHNAEFAKLVLYTAVPGHGSLIARTLKNRRSL